MAVKCMLGGNASGAALPGRQLLPARCREGRASVEAELRPPCAGRTCTQLQARNGWTKQTKGRQDSACDCTSLLLGSPTSEPSSSPSLRLAGCLAPMGPLNALSPHRSPSPSGAVPTGFHRAALSALPPKKLAMVLAGR